MQRTRIIRIIVLLCLSYPMYHTSGTPSITSGSFYECIGLGVRFFFIVFNATVNNFQLYRGSQFYWWKKPQSPEITTGMS
jgi:hypothetical protein